MGGFDWIALKEIGDKTLLISKEVLFNGYFDDRSNVYEKSKLNGFLNSQFINMLKENDFDDQYIVNGVWPLTSGQYNIYIKGKIKNAENPWFLRTPGKEGYILAVNTDGEIYEEEITSSCGLRPAMMIDTNYINSFVSEAVDTETVNEKNSDKDDIEQSVIDLVNSGTSDNIAAQLETVKKSQIELEQSSAAITDAANKDVEDTFKAAKDALAASHHTDKNIVPTNSNKNIASSNNPRENDNKMVPDTQDQPIIRSNNPEIEIVDSDPVVNNIPAKKITEEKRDKDSEHTEFATNEIKERNITIARLLYKNMDGIVHPAETKLSPETKKDLSQNEPIVLNSNTEVPNDSHVAKNPIPNNTSAPDVSFHKNQPDKSNMQAPQHFHSPKPANTKEPDFVKTPTNNVSELSMSTFNDKKASLPENKPCDNFDTSSSLLSDNRDKSDTQLIHDDKASQVKDTISNKPADKKMPASSIAQPVDMQQSVPEPNSEKNSEGFSKTKKTEQSNDDKLNSPKEPDKAISHKKDTRSDVSTVDDVVELPNEQFFKSESIADVHTKLEPQTQQIKPSDNESQTTEPHPTASPAVKDQQVSGDNSIPLSSNPPRNRDVKGDTLNPADVLKSSSDNACTDNAHPKDTNVQPVIEKSTITFEEVPTDPPRLKSTTAIINKINKAVAEKPLPQPNNTRSVDLLFQDDFDIPDSSEHQKDSSSIVAAPHPVEHPHTQQNQNNSAADSEERRTPTREGHSDFSINDSSRSADSPTISSAPVAPPPPVVKEKQIKKNDNSTYQENNKKIRKSGSSIFNKLGKKDALVEDTESSPAPANMSDIVNYYTSYSSQPSKEQLKQPQQRPSLRESELETLLATTADENEILKETIKKNNRLIVQLKTTLMEERSKYEELTKELNNLIKMKNKDFKAREKQYQETIDKYKALLAECAEELKKR